MATRFLFFLLFLFLSHLVPHGTWKEGGRGFYTFVFPCPCRVSQRHALKMFRGLRETTCSCAVARPSGPGWVGMGLEAWAECLGLFGRICFIYLHNGLCLSQFMLLFDMVFLVFRLLLNYVFQFLQLLITCPIFSLYPSFCLIQS